MRIILISDTHSLHEQMIYNLSDFLSPGNTNILIHAGDCTNVGRENEVGDFISWIQGMDGFDKKIFIAGNHDIPFESKPNWLNTYLYEENLQKSNITYLKDNFLTIDSPEFSRPIKIYGDKLQTETFTTTWKLQVYLQLLKSQPNRCHLTGRWTHNLGTEVPTVWYLPEKVQMVSFRVLPY